MSLDICSPPAFLNIVVATVAKTALGRGLPRPLSLLSLSPGIPCVRKLYLDMASGLCQEFHEHVDNEAVNLVSTQITITRLLDAR